MPPTILTWFVVAAVLRGAEAPRPSPEECRIRLVPADVSVPWSQAATSLDAHLRRSPPGDRDCREIVVDVGADRAQVTVWTTDGRKAVRPLQGADELVSTVEGLIVTVPGDILNASGPTGMPADRPGTSPAVQDTRLLLTAAGGARLSAPGTLAGAVLDAGVGLVGPRYELVASGVWSPGLALAVAGKGPAAPPSSLELGAGGGYRHHLRGGDLIAGARAGAVRTRGTRDDDTTVSAGQALPTRLLPFVGAYVALAAFAPARMRLRPQVLFQWLPTAVRKETSTDVPVGAFVPEWSLTLSIGAESQVL